MSCEFLEGKLAEAQQLLADTTNSALEKGLIEMSVAGFAVPTLLMGGAAQPGTYAYRTHIEDSSNATTYSGGSWNGIAIGDADPNRYVLVGIYGSSGTRTVSSVTIGGVSATLVSDGTNSARIQHSAGTSEFWIAAVPTGTTANISITWSGSQSRCGAGVWTMVRPKSTTAVDVDSSNSASPASVTLTTTNPGVVFAIGGNNSTGSYSWTNVTERYDSVFENANSGADAATTGSSLAVTATFTGSPAVRTLVCVAFDLGVSTPPDPKLLDSYSNITGAYSMNRTLLSSYSSALYTTATGISALNDQSGNARHFVQATGANQLAVTTAGPNNSSAVSLFTSGTVKNLSYSNVGDLITDSTGYIVAAFTNSTATDSLIFQGSPASASVYINNSDQLVASHFDGSLDTISSSASGLGDVLVVEWMHESGNLKRRINGASWDSTPSGGTSNISSPLYIGRTLNTNSGNLFEIVFFNALPSESQQDALVADMMDYYGAS